MAKPKVAITDYTFDDLNLEKGILEPAGCEIVGQKIGKDPRQIASLVEDADYVITQFAPVNADVIGAMRKCKIIVRYGIGVDNVDLKAAAAKGIPVCNVPDYCIDEVADHTLAMILDLTRKIMQNTAKVKAGGWGLAVPLDRDARLEGPDGRRRGFRTHRPRGGRSAPGVQVQDSGVRSGGGRRGDSAAGCAPASLDEVLSSSDLITLHCPSNADDAVHDQCREHRADEAGRHAGEHVAGHARENRRSGGGAGERSRSRRPRST